MNVRIRPAKKIAGISGSIGIYLTLVEAECMGFLCKQPEYHRMANRIRMWYDCILLEKDVRINDKGNIYVILNAEDMKKWAVMKGNIIPIWMEMIE